MKGTSVTKNSNVLDINFIITVVVKTKTKKSCGARLKQFCSNILQYRRQHIGQIVFPVLFTLGFVHWRLVLETWASSKYELEGSLDVTICSLQRPQHQLFILYPHVSELLQLRLPTALANTKSHNQKR